MRKNHLHFSDVTPALGTMGRPRNLSEYHAQELLDFLSQRFIVYQNDMIWFLYDEFDIVISQSTISRLLKQARYSRKIAQRVAAERDEKLRSEWKRRLMSWASNQLIFLDESAACERTLSNILDDAPGFNPSSRYQQPKTTAQKVTYASSPPHLLSYPPPDLSNPSLRQHPLRQPPPITSSRSSPFQPAAKSQ